MSKHLDCRNYAPLDVAKGLCHVRKEIILADDPSCEFFETLAKCKHCQHYAPGAEAFLGVCRADKALPMAYPDLIAVTCKWFAWTSN